MSLDQGYINHIVFCIDMSGSMHGLARETIQAFDAQIAYLATRSQEVDQETRVSVYVFNTRVECVVYDKDVLRLPSISEHYRPNGNTALIDGTMRALTELGETPQRYGDHAFLVYVLTDGFENSSRNRPVDLKTAIAKLPDNWTVAILVPDQKGVFEAKKFGFPADNIQLWDTSARGIDEVGRKFKAVTDTYMLNRSVGIRGSKNLFHMDTSALNSAATQLVELNPLGYHVILVNSDAPIKEFVESHTYRPYVLGSSFYELTKPEDVQHHKELIVRNVACGKLYGGSNARNLLGLPDQTVRVAPGNFANYEIFVQSTSTNRKLIGGTTLIVRI